MAAMKPLVKSRTMWIAGGQVFASALAATLAPDDFSGAKVVIKVLAALSAALGVVVLSLRAMDSRKAQ